MTAKESKAPSHVNNFDFLRLLFATLVLITHSYFLTGIPEHDPLWQFSHGQLRLSKLGLWGFFVISGYLILKSLLRSPSLKEYYFKRIIRVFPALWVMVGLTMIGAYFFSDKNLGAYLADRSLYLYLLNLVLRLHINIAGVFPANPVPTEINGSIWTVPYEFFFYLLLTPLFFIRYRLAWLRGSMLVAFVGLLVLQLTGHVDYPTRELGLLTEELIFLGLYFVAGGLLALFPSLIRQARLRTWTVWITGLGLLAVLYFGGYEQAQFFLLPVFVIAFGESNYPALSWIRRYGDISYGVYIWGWPVQQALVHLLHPSQPVLALLSIPIAWAIGAVSWHLLEKKVLRLKLALPAPRAEAEEAAIPQVQIAFSSPRQA